MDQPAATPNERPPVPIGTHRLARRRRRAKRAAWALAWSLIVASILLAIFVHRGLLGIAGLVGAVIVGYAMLRPSQWLWLDDDDEVEVRPRPADSPGRAETRPR